MNFIIFLSFAIAYVKNSNQIFSNLLFKMLANQAVNIKKFIYMKSEYRNGIERESAAQNLLEQIDKFLKDFLTFTGRQNY
jgi:hypothetical protein